MWLYITFSLPVLLITMSGLAIAHWDMDSRFWQDKNEDTLYRFRLHNGTHVNRQPTQRELNLCFWLEKKIDQDYRLISNKLCEPVFMRPDEWKDFKYSLNDLKAPIKGGKKSGFPKGMYRVKVSAKEKKNWLSAMLFGAALERLTIDLEFDNYHWKLVKKGSW